MNILIRIENLLEHTSGWNYWHFAELGSDNPKPKRLKKHLIIILSQEFQVLFRVHG